MGYLRTLYFRRTLSQFTPPIRESLDCLLRTERLSPDEIRECQNRKLCDLLLHAGTNVPFYEERFRKAGIDPGSVRSVDDLRNVPLLTKEDIRSNRAALRSRICEAGDLVTNHTGGSTGEPLTFYQDQRYLSFMHADLWRNYMWCGYRIGDPQLFVWGSDVDAKRYRGLKGRIRSTLQNVLWIDVFDLTEEGLRGKLQEIERFHPVLLVGYVSSLLLLARLCREENIELSGLKGVQSSAEVLTEPHRDILEQAFAVGVFDRYGCREVGNIACECEAHDGLHINAENNFVEFVDGKIVVTNLNNYGMPFIRYVVGDRGEPGTGERCSCGRGLPKMKVVTGRFSNLIRSPEGRILHGEFFTHLFYGAEGVVQFQVVQETESRLTVRIVKDERFDPAFEGDLRAKILTHGSPYFDISFEYPKHIDPLKSGKYQFTISKLSQKDEDLGDTH